MKAQLNSFRFVQNIEGSSFILGSFQDVADATKKFSAIIGNTGAVPFEMLLKAKSMNIPFLLEENGTWVDKNGENHQKYNVSIGTI